MVLGYIGACGYLFYYRFGDKLVYCGSFDFFPHFASEYSGYRQWPNLPDTMAEKMQLSIYLGSESMPLAEHFANIHH